MAKHDDSLMTSLLALQADLETKANEKWDEFKSGEGSYCEGWHDGAEYAERALSKVLADRQNGKE